MRSVGLIVLRRKLHEYFRLAAGGETVLVTDRNRVVAELGPSRPAWSAVPDDSRLAEAVRQGWLTPPPLSLTGPPPRKRVMRFEDLMNDLARDRG